MKIMRVALGGTAIALAAAACGGGVSASGPSSHHTTSHKTATTQAPASPPATAPPATTTLPTTAPLNPGTVIETTLKQFYSDIDLGDYQSAWGMLTSTAQGDLGSETNFANGHTGTSISNVAVNSVTVNSATDATAAVTFTTYQAPNLSSDGASCNTWSLSYDMVASGTTWYVGIATGGVSGDCSAPSAPASPNPSASPSTGSATIVLSATGPSDGQINYGPEGSMNTASGSVSQAYTATDSSNGLDYYAIDSTSDLAQAAVTCSISVNGQVLTQHEANSGADCQIGLDPISGNWTVES